MDKLSEQLATTPESGDNDREPLALAGALSLYDHSFTKATKAEANYVQPGPAPYQCGNCQYILWGGKRTGADLCQLVSGTVYADGACRLFKAKPDYRLEHDDTEKNVVPIGTYSDKPPVDHLRETRLKPARLLWRVDRWGWSETGEPRNE